jgi:chromosomal replication initiator protein
MGIEGVNIPKDVLDHIINLSGSNIRELEGATMSLAVYLAFGRPDSSKYRDITIEEAEKVVGGIFLNNERRIDIRTIQKETENYFSISHDDLIGSKRSHTISYPRQVAMYLSRSLTDKSYPEIAKEFGGKDHTTVIYAMKNVENTFMKDPIKKSEIDRLMSRINN